MRLLFTCFMLGLAWSGRTQTVTVYDPNAPVGVQVAPNANYEAGIWTQILMGENYRKVWSTEVSLPVFRLSTTGFTIKRLGGSKQTNSLYLIAADGTEWVLRSVDKDVKRGIPRLLQVTPFTAYKQQLITAAHPYGAAIVAKLVKKLDIAAPDPVYYYIADDTALGPYRQLFSGIVAMLEKVDLAPVGQVFETDSLLQILNTNTNASVDAKEYLKARLIDMIVGDWDRHEGNWMWWAKEKDGSMIFYPIPRDRDQALFRVGGIVPALAKMTFEPYLTGFKKPPLKLKKLNKKAEALDKIFLKPLREKDWVEITKDVVDELDDDIINSAVYQIPDAISVEHKEEIAGKLITRRNSLPQAILEYYRYLFQ